MSSIYTLYRGGFQISIEKEAEFFTAILPKPYQVKEVLEMNEVQEMKHVFNNVYKIRTYDEKLDVLMDRMRLNQSIPNVCHHAYHPVGDTATRYYLTDTIIVRFVANLELAKIEKILQDHGLGFLKNFPLSNTYLLRVTASAGKNPVKVCDDLAERTEIEYAEPNLVNRFQAMHRPVDNLFSQQWHLDSRPGIELVENADVAAIKAWDITRGKREVVVAILDDGFDITHPDLQGDHKIIGPRDFMDDDFFPLPRREDENYHGTPCAGVAIGEENGSGIVGIAPGCSFMPIRFDLRADDNLLYEMFEYAGKRADVLSCSWGPVPVFAPLSSLLYNQLSELSQNGGPKGKGTVICFAAGNYNAPIQDLENVTFQWRHPRRGLTETTGPIMNGHAAHPDVVCVAATTSQNRKAAYSNWGKEIALAAPSNNWHPLNPQQRLPGRGIWTTDNEVYGLGFEPGSRYTSQFGGTSSATPLVAGVAALVRSVNPGLSAKAVRKILEEHTDKIEDNQPDPVLNFRKGFYTTEGHSEWFGYGKVNAWKSVLAAQQLETTEDENSEVGQAESLKGKIRIVAAMVNPHGPERGNEQVLLINISDQPISLWQWKVKDNQDRTDTFMNIELVPGQVFHFTVQNLRLANSGGWIGLEDSQGRIIDEVSYSREDAEREGWLVKF